MAAPIPKQFVVTAHFSRKLSFPPYSTPNPISAFTSTKWITVTVDYGDRITVTVHLFANCRIAVTE